MSGWGAAAAAASGTTSSLPQTGQFWRPERSVLNVLRQVGQRASTALLNTSAGRHAVRLGRFRSESAMPTSGGNRDFPAFRGALQRTTPPTPQEATT